MRQFLAIWLVILTNILAAQVVPYNIIPDWVSTANGHYATGLGLADINGDGWKDLIVANGNDMARQHLVVYYNLGDGTFPLNPDWQSDDIDYHGHLAVGDLDHDGDMDVVVSVYIGESGFSSPGKIKIYYNQGVELESSPGYTSDPFYTFSCALGDADGDGDLDIAAVAGEPYGGILDYGKIFLNNNGLFSPAPEWQTSVQMGALDVEFGDFNRDGRMDVIFVCEGTPNMIYLADENHIIDPFPDWQSAENLTYINSVDVGYANNQAIVVMTENSQLGGNGKVRMYHFSDPLPATSMAAWYSNPFGYGSGILLNDVNLDGEVDLIYGGWWLPVKVALGSGNGFELTTSYTSSTSSVVEAILLADLGRQDEILAEESFTIDENQHNSHLIILGNQVVEGISQVRLNENILLPGEYCHVPGKPWLSIGLPLQHGDLVEVDYLHSPFPDMVITNWDSNKGNYIFYNTEGGTTGVNEQMKHSSSLTIFPNPVVNLLNLNIQGPSGPAFIEILNIEGKVMLSTKEYHADKIVIDVSALKAGVYQVRVSATHDVFHGMFVK